LSEAGLSNSAFIFGGILKEIVQRRNPIYPQQDIIRPIMAMRRMDYPCWWDHVYVGKVKRPGASPPARFRHGERYEVGGSRDTSISWPIPINWLEAVQKKDHWNAIVRKYGASTLRTPEILGRWHKRGADDTGLTTDNWQNADNVQHGSVIGPDFKKWVKNVKRSRIRAVGLPTEPDFNIDAEEGELLDEIGHRVRGAAIKVAERLQGNRRRQWAERNRKQGAGPANTKMA